jgi:hypothetical protein
VSIISTGINEIEEKGKEARQQMSSGKNTGKLLVPSKKNNEITVVPLVELNSPFPDTPQVIGYQQFVVYWDKDQLEELKKTDSTLENLFPIFSFPKFSSDPDIDVGLWLRNNKYVFETAKVKTSTMFGRSPENPIDLKDVLLTPVLWLDDPEASANGANNDEAEHKIYVLKTTQATIKKGLKTIFSVANRIRGMVIKIKLSDDGKSYSVNSIAPYEGELPTDFGFNTEDYVGFETRQKIVDTFAKYGVIIPPVPAEKQAELDKIEKAFASDD